MKQPSKMQYFFAQNWPLRMWLTAGPVFALAAVVRACQPSRATLQDWRALFWFLAAAVLSACLGYFAAFFCGWFVLGPVYYARDRINGGPFRPGDAVQILVGPYRGQITTVYSTWQGNSVRVRLGEKEKREYKDIFKWTQLLREEDSHSQLDNNETVV